MEKVTGGRRGAGESNSAPDIQNLAACIEDARLAALDGDPGPRDPTDFHALRGRLEAARTKLPPLYREAVWEPYVGVLDDLGPSGFVEVLLRDPSRERAAGLMLDIAHAILQNGEGFAEQATDAFQEVVSDLYDGFLSAEDRRGVNPPDKGVISPLVKWGGPDFGPYTFPIDATSIFGVRCAIVSLPPANTRRGLVAWAALGHETAGHDILGADTGLKAELAELVRKELEKEAVGHRLPEYWSSRIDETASDVLGILNMGPVAAIGLIAYFRGLSAAFTGAPRLRSDGPANDSHPADVLRGYLGSATVRLLSFSGAREWADVLATETDRDVSTIRLAGEVVDRQVARQSAEAVARALVQGKAESLEGHALGEIQNWRDRDEEIVQQLQAFLTTASPVAPTISSGMFAAHAVAATVTAALSKHGDIPSLFERMKVLLKIMHDANPSWGPLFVAHPGSIASHRAYVLSA